jgi:hypothetical protein
MESINSRRPGCKEKELIFGTWNVRTLFRTGALLSLLSQLKEYRLAITALQETRYHIHAKFAANNHLNDDHTIFPNKIFDTLLKTHQP